MNRARALADNAEQVADDVRRTVAAVKVIVDEVRSLVSPLVEWLKSK